MWRRESVGIRRAAEARFEHPVIERADSVLPNAHQGLREIFPEPWVDLRDDPIDALQRFGVDDDLAVARVGHLRVYGQVEARRPLADEGGDALDIGIAQELLLDGFQVL